MARLILKLSFSTFHGARAITPLVKYKYLAKNASPIHFVVKIRIGLGTKAKSLAGL